MGWPTPQEYNEAIQNPELMATLLETPTSPAHRRDIERRLNAFLVNLFPQQEDSQQEDQQR